MARLVDYFEIQELPEHLREARLTAMSPEERADYDQQAATIERIDAQEKAQAILDAHAVDIANNSMRQGRARKMALEMSDAAIEKRLTIINAELESLDSQWYKATRHTVFDQQQDINTRASLEDESKALSHERLMGLEDRVGVQTFYDKAIEVYDAQVDAEDKAQAELEANSPDDKTFLEMNYAERIAHVQGSKLVTMGELLGLTTEPVEE
jgi:hypothetical protein